MTNTPPYLSGDILLIEPNSGASGDMLVGALLDLGFDFEELREKLSLLPLDNYRLSARKCARSGIQATKFDVEVGHGHDHRHFSDIRAMIEGSRLSPWVKEKSIEAFRRLAEAEGKVHGRPADHVHFHEVGAVDSIVDIVGAMIAMEPLRSMRVVSSAVNVGQGTLDCQHGTYPVPGPAAEALLQGVPTFSNKVAGELTTPTGATLLRTLAGEFGARPAMKVFATGYGAGARETPGGANVLRVSVGAAVDAAPQASEAGGDQVAVIEATIDDMTPQAYGYFQEKALEEGALDVFATPICMKKNRPALKVTCVCAVGDIRRFAEVVFRETTTIGIRYTVADRITLRRDFEEVWTKYGPVSMKVSSLDGKPVNFVPEFEDCRRLAKEAGVPLKDIQAAALHGYLRNKQ
ncbi:MAG: nickel pincer cofactor biosynthesis protein LarC [Acidobacteriota bacterium]|jgi:uncharacterized protein (TIGR00299 family) protein|nr:nickel pincer cofactor biosynthesis protein LarC [Acidobacteriota bacterium]